MKDDAIRDEVFSSADFKDLDNLKEGCPNLFGKVSDEMKETLEEAFPGPVLPEGTTPAQAAQAFGEAAKALIGHELGHDCGKSQVKKRSHSTLLDNENYQTEDSAFFRGVEMHPILQQRNGPGSYRSSSQYPNFSAIPREEDSQLLPIETAPKDGSYVILFGPSGYLTVPARCEICRYDAEFRPKNPWVNHMNDAFTDGGGGEATHWMPLPPEIFRIFL